MRWCDIGFLPFRGDESSSNGQIEKGKKTRCTLLTAFFKEAWRNVSVKSYIGHLHNWFMLLLKN